MVWISQWWIGSVIGGLVVQVRIGYDILFNSS